MKENSNVSFLENNLDLIRLAAALQVLIFHTIHRLDISVPFWLEPLGVIPGVPIFFVISGFLVSSSFERRRSILDYIRKRALRIFPALWVCVLITVMVATFFGFSFMSGAAAGWLVAQFAGAIYTPGFLQEFGMGSYNGSLWTIPIELQFYLILPLIYVFSQNFRSNFGFIVLFVSFLMISVCITALFPSIGANNESSLEKLLRYSFLPHIYLFIFGILLQRHRVYMISAVAGRGVIWLIFYVTLALMLRGVPAAEIPLMLLLGITTISLAYSATSTAKFLRGNDISYGVYIYHGLVINIFVELNLSKSYSLILFVLAASIFMAIASWILVERPILRLKKSGAGVSSHGAKTVELR